MIDYHTVFSRKYLEFIILWYSESSSSRSLITVKLREHNNSVSRAYSVGIYKNHAKSSIQCTPTNSSLQTWRGRNICSPTRDRFRHHSTSTERDTVTCDVVLDVTFWHNTVLLEDKIWLFRTDMQRVCPRRHSGISWRPWLLSRQRWWSR